MPTWIWVLIAVIVVIAVIAAVFGRSAIQRRRTQRLQQHFGPEYDRTVEVTGGQREAESELAARQKQHKKLDIVALSQESSRAYAERWRQVQATFVDSPSVAVGEADRLVTEVMRERGYPVDDFEQQAADISVDHPDVVENYRAGHRIHLSQREREITTEEQRQAFVHYRALFEKLLHTDGQPAPTTNTKTNTKTNTNGKHDDSQEARA
jgi:hypothetical protein